MVGHLYHLRHIDTVLHGAAVRGVELCRFVIGHGRVIDIRLRPFGLPVAKVFAHHSLGFFWCDVTHHDDGGHVWAEGVGVVLLDVAVLQAHYGLRRGVAQRRVTFGQQRSFQVQAVDETWRLHQPGHHARGLALHNLEGALRQGRVQFIGCQQFHAFIKVLGRGGQAEVATGRLVGGDAVECRLELQAVSAFRAKAEQAIQHVGYTFLARFGLHIFVGIDTTGDIDGIADRFRLHNYPQTVSQVEVSRLNGGLRHAQLGKRGLGPFRQRDCTVGAGGKAFSTTKAFAGNGLAGAGRSQGGGDCRL